MITMQKEMAGSYRLIRNAEPVGYVLKVENGWAAYCEEYGIQTEIHKTRKAAVEHFADELEKEIKDIQERKAIVEAARQVEQLSWEDELKAEIQAKVDQKIQAAEPGSKTTIWRGTDKMELKGSKLLDFMEFIFIDSDGDIITEAQLEKRCQAMAEDDGDDEITADSYMDNFADCWGDYKRAWAAANADQLCDCCKGNNVNHFGSVKGSETKSIIRMITCPECQGDGLELGDLDLEAPEDEVDYKKKAASIFDRFSVMPGSQSVGSKIPDPPKCMTCFDSGRIADDILCPDCDDHFLEDLAKDADQHLEQLLQPDHIREMIIQEMVLISQKRGIKGEELDQGIKWMRSLSTPALKSYLKTFREKPELIMPQEERDRLGISW
jgi:hypothetical protein